ncbi:15630_t:CDS:2 [Funneliformis mosseae]|uniref:15630_t:CDS:1 n=1 Tax=Funneliformis mosseae TaxID=27381 RepID=A0A9N9CV36_FUNMO|nr:15630_t:CDS:2 [Funneliformis mosseae]
MLVFKLDKVGRIVSEVFLKLYNAKNFAIKIPATLRNLPSTKQPPTTEMQCLSSILGQELERTSLRDTGKG